MFTENSNLPIFSIVNSTHNITDKISLQWRYNIAINKCLFSTLF